MGNRIFINYKNKKITINQLSKLSNGINISTLAARRRKHPTYTGEQLLELTPCKMITDKNGVTKSIKDWAVEKGCSAELIRVTLRTKTLDQILSKNINQTVTRTADILDDVDITGLAYNPKQHLINLYSQGLSFMDIKKRLLSAGLLDEVLN